MSFIRKFTKDYYICRIPKGSKGKSGNYNKKNFRNWYLIKDNNKAGTITIGQITFPKEFIGKRVRFKVEFVK